MSENHVIVACPYSYPFGSRYELEGTYLTVPAEGQLEFVNESN